MGVNPHRTLAIAHRQGQSLAVWRGLAVALFILTVWPVGARAATNSADNVAGGSVTLTNSGNVTVNAATLQLVKQVWTTGGACLASIPADPTCNGSATTVTVPSGTMLKFLIFVKNISDLTLTDVRFQDLLSDTAGAAGGFTYSAGTIKRTQTAAGEPLDTDTAATIFTNADTGTALTDAVTNADVSGINTAASPDDLTVGAAGNATLSLTAHKSFGIVFQASKN